MSLILAVDSGNTCIKWGLFDGVRRLESGNVVHGDSSLLRDCWFNLPNPSFIIASNVAGLSAQKILSDLFSWWNLSPHWVTALSYQCGVRNTYQVHSQLGSDRWAALIAAWNRYYQACLVINVGTAMTVDILSESGDFLGGIITPGPNSLLRILQNDTAILNLQSGNFDELPICTDNAVHSGVIQSLVGAVDRMYRLIPRDSGCNVHKCIISGGSASLLLPHFEFPVCVVDNLVLEGLVRIAREVCL